MSNRRVQTPKPVGSRRAKAHQQAVVDIRRGSAASPHRLRNESDRNDWRKIRQSRNWENA